MCTDVKQVQESDEPRCVSIPSGIEESRTKFEIVKFNLVYNAISMNIYDFTGKN